MAMAKQIDPEYFALEVGATWIALSEVIGNTAEGRAKLEECRRLKGEMVFDEIQKTLKIPPGDPYTVGKAISDYLLKVGSSDVQLHKLSDNEMFYEMKLAIMEPILSQFSEKHLRALPAAALFTAAFKKLSNVQVEAVPVSDEMRATVLKGKRGPVWRLSPIS